MSENQILIPRKELLEAKEFYANRTDKALRNLLEENHQPVYMPQIADARIEAPKEARIWQTWYTTPSVRATGRTKQGTPVVVYAHIPNYFSNPDNIENAIEQGLVRYAGKMPQKEFQRLLDLGDDKTVFVVDYDKLKNSTSGAISISKALKHPQTIPFLGCEERAESYLQKHEEVYGNKIGIWHSDDLADKPLGRLLFLGGSYYDDLGGGDGLDYNGRFVGVNSAGGARKKFGLPPLEELLSLKKVLSVINNPDYNREDMVKRITEEYDNGGEQKQC